MISCEQFLPSETLQTLLEQTYALCNEEIDLSVEFLWLKQLLDRMHWSADLCKAFKLDKLGVGSEGSGSAAKASATSFAAVSRCFCELLNQLRAFSKQSRQQSSASAASGSSAQSPQKQLAPPRATDCYCSLQQLRALTESGLQLAENPLVTVTSPLTLDYASLPGTKFMKATLEQLRVREFSLCSECTVLQ